jgi:ABC-type amino acid transport system permease subunit
LGLPYVARVKDVILPQALRIAQPATVGYLVQLIKGTSLARGFALGISLTSQRGLARLGRDRFYLPA